MFSWLLTFVLIGYFSCALISERSALHCTRHDECLNISSKSLCRNNLCSCYHGYIFNDRGICKKVSKLHEHCETSEYCSGDVENSYCSDRKICECARNYKSNDDENYCTKKNLSEVECMSDHDCHQIVPESRCNVFNSCFCESGYYDEQGCTNLSISECDDSQECSLILSRSICVDGKCLCPEDFIQVNESFCRQIVLEKCSDNSTCQTSNPFSFCSGDGSCECISGYYLSESGTCISRRLGDECRLNSDCEDVIPYSVCTGGVCRCKLGYKRGAVFHCVQIQIGDACRQDEECNTSINNSYCHGNLFSCHCNSGFVENDFSMTCNKLKIGRGECRNSTECLDAIADSYCNEDLVCQCVSGHAVGWNLDTCIRRKIGDRNCQVQTDCSDSISNGNCSLEGQCVCDVGHYPDKVDPYTCLRRVLGDESSCTMDVDCSAVISNSECFNHSCQCMLGFIGDYDNKGCRPRILGDECLVDEDCSTKILSSFCRPEKLCVCLSGFAGISSNTCQKRKIGDQNCATDSDCYDAVKDSECRNGSFDTAGGNKNESYVNACLCKLGFYEQNNGTICVLRQIGDPCINDDDCSNAVIYSVCDEKSSNCTCDYDHMIIPPDLSNCMDRPIIDQYKPDRVLKSFRKMYGCGRVFQYHKHTQQCPMAISCAEGGKMRDIYRKQPNCQRANAYVLKFNCSLIVGKYELIPIKYDINYTYNKTSDPYWENALRLSFYGVDQIMHEMNSSLSRQAFHAIASRYFSSRVLHFEAIKDGMQAIIAIFFKLDKNSSEMDMETIKNMIFDFLDRSDGQIGLSKIYIREPYDENFLVEDYDECETNSSFPAVLDSNIERNDCNQNAICANIQGFYQCVCDTSFVDKSEDLEFPGRTCTYKSDALEFELLLSQKECTEENKCETPWSFVIFVTTIIFGLLFLLLAFETVWRMKQMSRSLDV